MIASPMMTKEPGHLVTIVAVLLEPCIIQDATPKNARNATVKRWGAVALTRKMNSETFS